MKKVVLRLEINKDKLKKKAMKTVLGLSGVESFSVDMKEKELTLIGNIDPIKVVAKLKKVCPAEIISVGPVNEGNKNGINPSIFYGAASVEGDPHPHPHRCVIM